MPQHQQLLVTEAGVRGHQHWNTTTTITIDSAAKATNLRPAKLPQVPTNERLSFAVDQFTGSGHYVFNQSCRCRSAVPGCFLSELHAGGESEFGVDVGEVGLHGAR